MNPTDLSPAAALALGFARQVQRWALARGAPPEAAAAAQAAARALSLATGEGHVCLRLQDLAEADLGAASAGLPGDAHPGLPGDLSHWRHQLLASAVVGRHDAPGQLPLVLDAEDRLYLHRYFDFERRLARRLVLAAHQPTRDAGRDAPTRAQLATLFAGNAPPAGDADWQKLAAGLALRGRLTVISGGPGTGKTTTVVNLLACLLAQQPEARVVLAAPTGKAAARLSEALRQRAGHLDATLRARLPSESYTVHRLLGVLPDGHPDAGEGGFAHHAGAPLALDALVVDEASMLDLALATRLLEAVPASARIILLGDKDQLAAVESGAVFAELSADPTLSPACVADLATLCDVAPALIRPAAPVQASALHDSAVWFNRNFRFASDSGIGRLASDTLHGRADAALAWLRSGQDASVHWLDDGGAQPAPATLAQIAAGYAPFVTACAAVALPSDGAKATDGADGADRAGPGTAPAAVAAITEAFGRFRVLCAVREGPRGVAAVNDAVSRLLRPALAPAAADGRSPWYRGRPVMVLHNDYGLKLFNGDIGITLPGADGALMVWFPAADGGFRAVAPLRLPAHQTAWAMTVHKSQGSEFSAVLLLLPAQRSRVLTRELLYTGLTRARDRVQLAASAPVLAGAMQSGSQRHSGLLARLAEALAAATALDRPVPPP